MQKISSRELEAKLTATTYTILDFASPGCAPCKPAAALVEEVVEETRKLNISIEGFTVDITEEPEIARRFFVLGVPTIILFKESREIGRFSGIPKKEKLLKVLN